MLFFRDGTIGILSVRLFGAFICFKLGQSLIPSPWL